MPFDFKTGKPEEEDHGPTNAGTIANYWWDKIKVDPTVEEANGRAHQVAGFTPERSTETRLNE